MGRPARWRRTLPYGPAGLIIVAHAAGGSDGGLLFVDGLD